MNEILGLVGTVCICGAFYLMARKKADEVEELKKRVNELHEISLYDNGVLTKRMEQIGDLQEDVRKGADRFAKDQVEIADLNKQICGANFEIVGLRYQLEDMKKIGFRKIERARRLSR